MMLYNKREISKWYNTHNSWDSRTSFKQLLLIRFMPHEGKVNHYFKILSIHTNVCNALDCKKINK